MARKKIVIAATVVGSFVVLLLVTLLAVGILFPADRIKAMIVLKIEETLGRRVVVEKAALSVFPSLGIELKGLSVSETQRAGFDTSAFISVGELEFRLALKALLQRRIDVTTIRLVRPWVRVAVDTAGSYNFDDLAILKKDKESAQPRTKATGPGVILPLPLSLRRLTIADGKVEYVDARQCRTVRIDSIGQWFSMSADRTMENVVSTGEVVLKNVQLQTPQTAKPIRDVAVTLSHDVAVNLRDGSATVNALRLSLQDVYVNATGKVSDLASGLRYDLTVTSDTLELQKLLAAVPADLIPSLKDAVGRGSLFLKVLLRGGGPEATASPNIDGTIEIRNGMVQYKGLPEAVRDIQARITFTADRLSVAPLSLRLGANPIEIRGTIEHFAQPTVDMAVNATVNLGELKNVIALPPGNTLDGMLEATLTASGLADASDPSKLDVKGSVHLKHVVVQTPALAKPAVFNGTVNLTSRQISPTMTLEIASSKIAFNANLANYLTLLLPGGTKKYPRPTLDIRIASTSLNTNEFLPQNAEAKKREEAVGTQTPPALLLPAPLPGIDVSANITTSNLRYQDFELNNLKMNYSMIDDRIQATVHSGIFDGSFSQSLRVDARNIRDLKVESTLKVERADISRMLSATKRWLGTSTPLSRELGKLDRHLFGKANATISFTTYGGTMPELTKNLKATITSQLANGRIATGDFIGRINGALQKLKIIDLRDIEFRQLNLVARIEEEKVYIDDIRIGSPATGDWKAMGAVGFNGSMEIELTNRLPANLSSLVTKGVSTLASAAKSAVAKTPLAGASTLIDQVGPRPDSEGRYIIHTKLHGLLPSFSVDAFRFVDGGGATAARPVATPAAALQQQLQQEVQEVQQQAKEIVQQKVQEAQERATAEVKKSVETGKKKALDLLKKF